MSTELNLLPCPFCGTAAELVDSGTGSWRVACRQSKGGCGATGRMTFDGGAMAVSEWNRRASPAAAVQTEQAEELTLGNAPLGTKAPGFGGGYWVRTEQGWKWCAGSTFPRPGGDWTGDLIAPVRAQAGGVVNLTPEHVEKYINAADDGLGHWCTDEWAEQCRRILRVTAKQNTNK